MPSLPEAVPSLFQGRQRSPFLREMVVDNAQCGSRKRKNVSNTERGERDQPLSSPSDKRPRKCLRQGVVDMLSKLAGSIKLGEIIRNQWKRDEPPEDSNLFLLSAFIKETSRYSGTPVDSKYTTVFPHGLADRLKDGGDLWGRVYDVLQRCAQDSEWDLFIQLLESDFADKSTATMAFGVPDESTADYDREQRLGKTAIFLINMGRALTENLIATVRSWKTSFRGRSSELLWKSILLYNQSTDATDRYANIFAIVNSSGMGKSRTVDDFSQEHFVIPICFRKQGSSGYPPSDSDVCNFFNKEEKDRDHGHVRCLAFLASLFAQATEEVKRIKEVNQGASYAFISSTFRSLMQVAPETAGSSDRIRFYRKVIQDAEELRVHLVNNHEVKFYYYAESPPPMADSDSNLQLPASGTVLRTEAPKLHENVIQNFLGLAKELSDRSRTQLAGREELLNHREEPLVFIAFDEAHTLQRIYSYVGEEDGLRKELKWSYFTCMRRAFRKLKSQPIFGIFISTTGRVSQFNLDPEEDISSRNHSMHFKNIPPFSDMGYDQFAPRVSFRHYDGPVKPQLYFMFNLEKVSPLQEPKPLTMDAARHIRFMARFGRALFPLRYIFGNKEIQKDIVSFAISKLILLQRAVNMGQVVDADTRVKKGGERQRLSRIFACLSQRLALEFNYALSNAEAREPEEKQVEAHMRICLKTEQPSNRMVTTSGSEPLLSEAAAYVMSQENFNPPRALRDLLQGYSIHKGDTGELVATLLAIMARDDAVGYSSNTDVEDNEHLPLVDRTVSVKAFFDGLLRKGLDAESQKVYDELCKEAGENIARMFFNHFIKAHQQSTCTLQFILLCVTRAAALLCATNMPGIDFLLPILLGTLFKLECLTYALFQVKNDSSIQEKDASKIFADMFEKGKSMLIGNQPPKFVIRVVMSLASRPGVSWSKREVSHNGKKFPSYDCWIGGLDHNVLKAVKPGNTELWNSLGGVKRSKEMFMMEDYGEPKEKNETRMSMCTGGGSDPEFWPWAEHMSESTTEVAEGRTDSVSARDSQRMQKAKPKPSKQSQRSAKEPSKQNRRSGKGKLTC